MSAGSDGFALVAPEKDGCRSATAIGLTYRRRSTKTPIPVHQYRSPLDRTATNPYGFAAATAA